MASPIPTQLSPGVNISEIDLSQFVQPESLNSAGMVGTFNWGPALVANRVASESTLAALFGKPTLDQSDTLSEDDFFAAANFLKYSNNLKVVRILQDDDYNATTKEPGITMISHLDHAVISNEEEFEKLGGFSGQNGIESIAHFRARYPGNFGDSLKVVVFDGGVGSSETTTTDFYDGLIDYDVLGPNFIGITYGTIGLTLEALAVDPFAVPPEQIVLSGSTFISIPYYTITLDIGENVDNLTDAAAFSIAYASGTTSQNFTLTDNGNEPSGNRANYFRPYDYSTAEIYNFFENTDVKDLLIKPTSDGLYKILFLDADINSLAPAFDINPGSNLPGTNRPITNITLQAVSGLPVEFYDPSNAPHLFANYSNFNWYRKTASKFPDKIFAGGVAPTSGVKGWAKFIAMTGGVSYTSWPNGVDEVVVGLTFDSIGGITGVIRDFTFGMKQFVYDGVYTVTTTTQTPGGNLSSPVFDKLPQTSAYAKSVGGSNDEISFAVIDTNGKFGAKGAILERFELLSKAVDAKNLNGESIYYKDFINRNSGYVYMTKPLGYTGGAGNASSDATTVFGDIVQNYVDVSGVNKTQVSIYDAQLDLGQSGITNTTLTEYSKAYKLFADDDNAVDILFVPESSVSSLASSEINTDVERLAYDTVIAPRKDTILVLPTPKPANTLQDTAVTATQTINFRNRLSVPSNSYTILVAGRKVYFDTFNNQLRKMSLSSDVAGIMAAQEIPWESPAGFSRGLIRNAIKLETNFTKADRDELYKNSINFFVQFNDGSGTVLFGDKTLLKKPSAFDRINVRRVFISLEKAIAKASKYSLFEFNDEFTRSQFRNLVVPFLSTVQSQRGIADFKVVCDETNNTQEVIDKNQFVADIYIKPAKSVNFIQLNFVAVRSDFNLTTLE